MKNLFLLFLCIGLMSFTSNKISNVKKIQTCCTATYYINGEPAASATACVSGIGPETSALACAIAKSDVRRQLAITQ